MGSYSILWSLGLVFVVFGILNIGIGLFGAGFDRLWIGGNLIIGLLLLVTAAVEARAEETDSDVEDPEDDEDETQ